MTGDSIVNKPHVAISNDGAGEIETTPSMLGVDVWSELNQCIETLS